VEKRDFPILEFDPRRTVVIEPEDHVRAIDAPQHCVITFFQKVVEKVVAEHKGKTITTFPWEDGPHHVYKIEHKGRRLALPHPDVGAPVSAAILEDAAALGRCVPNALATGRSNSSEPMKEANGKAPLTRRFSGWGLRQDLRRRGASEPPSTDPEVRLSVSLPDIA
jgi:hypothetical protein